MSTLTIEVVNVSKATVPTAKGSYDVLDVAYKNKSFQDKLEGKKVMSFTNKEVFTSLSKAQFGDVFYVNRVKNDKGFWDWVSVSTDNTDADTASSTAATINLSSRTPTVGNVTPKSNYETPEERAARQVLIVRQSSISSAVELAVANKIKDTQEVIKIAKEFEAFVFGKEAPTEVVQETPTNFFEDFENDLP